MSDATGRRLPALACDCHAHVFGPFDRFPLAEVRPYTPPESPVGDYMAMLDAAGFARGVLVHGGAAGWDQGAMVDALRGAPGRLRGVAVPPISVSDETLADLHAAGVRGVRFTSVAGPSAAKDFDGRLGLADLAAFAPRLRALGWHAQIWANCSVFEENESVLRSYGVSIVADHMGHFEAGLGVSDGAFQALVRLVRDGVAWVKLSAFRNSGGAPGYADVRPFQEALIEAGSGQLVWGSDWPFLGMTGEKRPTTEGLRDLLLEWLADDALADQILSRNPARLYGFS